jgi:hypothetical protein
LKRFVRRGHYQGWTSIGVEPMDHSEAVQQMAAERYLLDELTQDAREAFEEHFFDCHRVCPRSSRRSRICREAKAQLPELTSAAPAPVRRPVPASPGQAGVVAVLASAGLCRSRLRHLAAGLGYQNLVTYPALRASATNRAFFPGLRCTEPRGWRSPDHHRRSPHGVALPVDLPPQPSVGAYASYSFDLYDPQGKLAWTGVAAAPAERRRRRPAALPGDSRRDAAQRRLYHCCLRRRGSWGTHRNRQIRLRSSFDRLTRLKMTP